MVTFRVGHFHSTMQAGDSTGCLGFRVWGLGEDFGGILEFPKIRGTLFGGPNNKDYSILGVYIGGPLILGNYHFELSASYLRMF